MKAKRNHHPRTRSKTTQRGSEEQQSTPLVAHWLSEERWYIAVHANGYGVARDLCAAISVAQESVEMKAKPSQLCLYVSTAEIEPTGFVKWPNGAKPRLVGCTNTHQGWVPKPRA